MRKRLIAAPLLCGALLSLAACGDYSIPDSTPPLSQSADANPFEAAEDESGFLATLTHGAASPDFSESGERLPFAYDGGEFQLAYQYSVTGKLDAVGFLLFLDGKPQPYKVNDTAAEYEYCHSFAAGEEGKDQDFSFLFEPVTGSAGDTLTLTVVSITNPDFQPDMESTSGYGWYHKCLEYRTQLQFNESASPDIPFQAKATDAFSNVNIQEEKITSAYIVETLRQNGWDGVTMDNLNQDVYYTADFNDHIVFDNFCLSDSDEVAFRYTICGIPGVEYDLSFFIDHQPVCLDNGLSYHVALSKGNRWVFEIAFDASKMDSFQTFYVMAVPKNSGNDVLLVLKSSSILLYKENEQ